MGLFDVAMIRHQLNQDKNNMVIVPDLESSVMLTEVYDIPAERVGVLLSVIVALEKPDYLIMSRRQYNYYKRKEDKVLQEVRATDGNNHNY